MSTMPELVSAATSSMSSSESAGVGSNQLTWSSALLMYTFSQCVWRSASSIASLVLEKCSALAIRAVTLVGPRMPSQVYGSRAAIIRPSYGFAVSLPAADAGIVLHPGVSGGRPGDPDSAPHSPLCLYAAWRRPRNGPVSFVWIVDPQLFHHSHHGAARHADEIGPDRRFFRHAVCRACGRAMARNGTGRECRRRRHPHVDVDLSGDSLSIVDEGGDRDRRYHRHHSFDGDARC